MSFLEDEEILEDFLVEAGEILEQLSDQLVQLEQNPDDRDLLNAIFRGFHTVKGGAGFLQLNAMVELCHVTENLFDLLRNGQLEVGSDLMDVVLQALDAVNTMFDQVRERLDPEPADPALMENLNRLVQGEQVVSGAGASAAEAESSSTASDVAGNADDSSGDDNSDDEITEEEFEALLDELQGSGKAGTAPAATVSEDVASTHTDSAAADSDEDDEISDSEFEALLDQLHGPGSHGGIPKNAETADTTPEETSEPAAKDARTGTASSPAAASAPKPAAGPAGSNGDDSTRKDKPAASKPAGAGPADVSVRVDTRRLDEIMNMVGELVLVRNRLVRIGDNNHDEELSKAVSNLDLVTADLQSSVMKTRMQPVKKVFGRFPRVVRDLARSLKKEVALETLGEETDLDKNLVEALADPMVHLVRNAVDHGIEMPDEREARGKQRKGTVLLSAEQEGDHILLTIQDDGHGMDPNALRRKAVEKGLFDQEAADRLSDTECFELIFAPGFSTKQEISDVSGRGVGMDVVKTKITQLNGTVSIDSKVGKGTRIDIKVPLTLAIMPTLMVVVGEQTFALPLGSVDEIFNLNLGKTNMVDGRQVVTVRDKALPLFHLRRWLMQDHGLDVPDRDANVVIVSVGTQRIGFVVDNLVGQEEVVIKPLGRILHGTPGMAGATITGDGRIALILDVAGLLKRYAN